MIRIRREDSGYPPLLPLISEPPAEIWVEGDSSLLARTAVAIVGSRAATQLGLDMAERLAAGLAAEGVVVVSGCAHGIDAAAHRAALEVGGATVAVLAGGLDIAAPPSTRLLAQRIGREGCLVSEHAAGVPPLKYLFPLRNRIIASLTRIVIVVEASARSGALITADHALDAGRDVMAVPGHPLLANSAGVNRLLADGARPAVSVEGVIAHLEAMPPAEGLAPWAPGVRPSPRVAPSASQPGGPFRRRLLDAIGERPEPAEALAARIRAPVPIVLATLTELELMGLVRSHAGQRYGRTGPVADRRGEPR